MATLLASLGYANWGGASSTPRLLAAGRGAGCRAPSPSSSTDLTSLPSELGHHLLGVSLPGPEPMNLGSRSPAAAAGLI